MNDQQKQAEHLYLNTEKSQKEIAQQLGIDPKTLYRWIKQGHWRQLKSTTRRMPSVLVENIYSQLDDINYNISQRERGSRHPGKDESLTINRLINCIEKVKKQTSQGQNIEFMMNFIDWVMPQNKDLADLLTNYGSAFLKGNTVQGFHPYDIEYPNPEVKEEDEELKERHPEFISGPHASTGNLAQVNSPLERGQGCVQLSSHAWPIDPNCTNPKPRHPEFISGPHASTNLFASNNSPWPTDPNRPSTIHNDISLSFGEGRGEALLTPEESSARVPWPTDLNLPSTIHSNISLSFGEGRGEAPIASDQAQTGHDSGIPIQLEISFQPTENQSEQTGTPNNPMPENNSLDNRASETAGNNLDTCQLPPSTATNEHPTDSPPPLSTAINFPPASEIDFSNPNVLYELAMKQKKESEDEYQFYSIGDAVYRIKVDKTKKRRR
ncbi:MAG: helix-turn-helix domain-containing protein [Bacteroidetes bacterium]|nr:helix-turn-helix domain-containing protein [Bacteroidota bacterium]